jgi:ABC-type cobalamin transport system ATPase subunit
MKGWINLSVEVPDLEKRVIWAYAFKPLDIMEDLLIGSLDQVSGGENVRINLPCGILYIHIEEFTHWCELPEFIRT